MAYYDKSNVPITNPSWVIQRYILAVLYNSLAGGNWQNQYNFLSSDHECRWNGNWNEIYSLIEGITCDEFNNAIFIILGTFVAPFVLFCFVCFFGIIRVENVLIFPSLYLYFPYTQIARNGLKGILPTQELNFLSNLRRLNLENNDCSGTLGDFGNLSNLEQLVLNFNQFSGFIPSDIGRLQKLEALHLRKNRLSGDLPTSLGCLSNLTSLVVADNTLIGTYVSQTVLIQTPNCLYQAVVH